MRLPLGGGMVFRTSGTWPRTKALYCYPASVEEWPADPEIVERVGLRSRVRRRRRDRPDPDRLEEPVAARVHHCPRPGRGLLAVARTRKQARPGRGAPPPPAQLGSNGSGDSVGARHVHLPVAVGKRGRPLGPPAEAWLPVRWLRGGVRGGRLVASSVERKSLPTWSRLSDQAANCAPPSAIRLLGRAADVVEPGFSTMLKLDGCRAHAGSPAASGDPGPLADPAGGLEPGKLAEESTYRFLAAARV